MTAPQNMETYEIQSPVTSHFRVASCDEYGCAGREHGWVTLLDESIEQQAGWAQWIRTKSSRRFREERNGQLVTFTFEPGQTCFRTHNVPVHRPPIFLVRQGNLTVRGSVVRHHTSGESWMDDLHTNTDKVVTALGRG
ncbi:hypothetical protein [Lentzea sp. NPDC092896]|uniref:hypothetical protein n=1 Tax=Lentzea sp. NPDC092896 TaxID=3364127 RepID=UPI003811FA73